jgi:two-component system, NtrC family, sensor kinase
MTIDRQRSSDVAADASPSSKSDAKLIRSLMQSLAPIVPTMPVLAVGERFLDPDTAPWLSLPVVAGNQPIGSMSRYELMQRVYIKPFGRELHGKRPIIELMHTQPLLLNADTTIEEASRFIAEHIRRPIMEDFIVVDDKGHYVGVGKVLDVLGAMEAQLSENAANLDQAYRKLQSSQTQLIQSEKMASLGQMVAGVAHEINTPLGYVRNNVEMTRATMADIGKLIAGYESVIDALHSGADETEFARRVGQLDSQRDGVDSTTIDDLRALLDDTVFGVGQIADLVGNLKDFSRLDQDRTENVDVRQLIESALKIGGNIIRKKNIEVVRHFGEVPAIECSPAQINQVLLNLITNAAQAIELPAGRITIRTHRVGNYALIAVEDNGKGIAPQNLEKIFEPFFTTKPIGQGTGLGLSICYQIVEQHGGRIRATSSPATGTRFLVALPLRANREKKNDR